MLEIYPEMTTQEAKEERRYLRVWVGRVVVLLCALVAVAWSTGAYSEEIPVHVLEKDGVTIRLMNTPCVDPFSLAMILPNQHGRFKAVQSVWPERDGSRKAYAGCWTLLTPQESGGEEGFLIVFEDGANGFIPKAEFKKVRGQSAI